MQIRKKERSVDYIFYLDQYAENQCIYFHIRYLHDNISINCYIWLVWILWSFSILHILLPYSEKINNCHKTINKHTKMRSRRKWLTSNDIYVYVIMSVCIFPSTAFPLSFPSLSPFLLYFLFKSGRIKYRFKF